MSDVLDRFIKYCKVSSQSNPLTANTVPSTESQHQMAKVVAADLRDLGAEDVTVNEHAYVVAHWPASEGLEDLPTLGFCCHLDTAWQSWGNSVHPQVVTYKGGKFTVGYDPNGREVSISPETNAERVSLSPTFSSFETIASFSFITGIILFFRRVLQTFLALRYLLLSEKSPLVSRS